jgi:hypothetical protein
VKIHAQRQLLKEIIFDATDGFVPNKLGIADFDLSPRPRGCKISPPENRGALQTYDCLPAIALQAGLLYESDFDITKMTIRNYNATLRRKFFDLLKQHQSARHYHLQLIIARNNFY